MIGVLLAASLMVAASGFAEDNTGCGIVVGLTAEWWQGGRPVTLGSRVSRAAVRDLLPTGDSTKKDDRLTLTVWFQPRPPETYPCVKTPCTVANIDDACANQKEGVAKRLGREPSKYFMAASRGLEGDVAEAVLPLTESQVDVGPALQKVDAGKYRVRFDSLRRATDSTPSFGIEWHPGNAARVSASGLKPDLYRLALLDSSGEPTGSEAWVLVSDTEHYTTISARFQQMLNQVATWPPEVDPQAIRAVLRATLESLAGVETSKRP